MVRTEPCFVIGTGRCGSTLLSNLVRLHSDVLSLSEFFSMLGGPRILSLHGVDGPDLTRLLLRLDDDILDQLRAGPIPELLCDQSEAATGAVPPLMLVTLPHLTHAPASLQAELFEQLRSLPRAPPRQHLQRVFQVLAARLQRTQCIERSGMSAEYVDLLQSHWPHAKYVFLLRNGPECALSMSRHLSFQVRVARVARGLPNLPVAQCLAEPVPLHRFGAYWSALTIKMQRAAAALPAHQVLVFRYEELLAEPRQTLQQLWRFLALEQPEDAVVDRMTSLVGAPRSGLCRLPARQRSELGRACRPGMRALSQLLVRSPLAHVDAFTRAAESTLASD